MRAARNDRAPDPKEERRRRNKARAGRSPVAGLKRQYKEHEQAIPTRREDETCSKEQAHL